MLTFTFLNPILKEIPSTFYTMIAVPRDDERHTVVRARAASVGCVRAVRRELERRDPDCGHGHTGHGEDTYGRALYGHPVYVEPATVYDSRQGF